MEETWCAQSAKTSSGWATSTPGGVPGRHELDNTQGSAVGRGDARILASNFQGYVAHEFVPTRDRLLPCGKPSICAMCNAGPERFAAELGRLVQRRRVRSTKTKAARNGGAHEADLVTGATGKVGRHFIERVLQSGELPDVKIHALCHNRLPATARAPGGCPGQYFRSCVRAQSPGRCHSCVALRHVQGNLGRHYRRFRERAFLAPRRVPD